MDILLQVIPLASEGLPGGYLWGLLRALLALVGVLLLAWLVLRWLASRGVGTTAAGTQRRLRLLERLPLDARRSVCLIKADDRVLVVGLGEGDAPRLLTELSPSEQALTTAASPAGTPQKAMSSEEGSDERTSSE